MPLLSHTIRGLGASLHPMHSILYPIYRNNRRPNPVLPNDITCRCWQDEFMHLTMEDIRVLEAETMARLMTVMASGEATDTVDIDTPLGFGSLSSSASAARRRRLVAPLTTNYT